jgi:ammonium transporter, Amt family
MKQFLPVFRCAAASLGLLLGTAHAQDASAPAPTPAASAGAAPSPTIEQRVGGLEAYVANGDPTAPLQDAKGNVPEGVMTVAASNPGPGHNAWMMTSSALVLFMTLPGLILFYGGLVRRKNVLSVCAQCLGTAGLVGLLWWAFGYSLVFGKSFHSGILGGSEYFFLNWDHVNSKPNPDYSFWVSHNVFAMFQMMFAIITPALIVGAIAERMKFRAIMAFMVCWMFLVYFPMAHMVWGVTGAMNGIGNPDASIAAIDFAGGTVVHMTSGWSALILCLVLGKRIGFGRDKMAPHNMVLCVVGTGMLWVGWYGFNAGSALASDGIAANAFTTTTLAAAVAGLTWGMLEATTKGHASILGFCSGIVSGLVVITPACGFVTPSAAVFIGIVAAIIPFLFVVYVKNIFKYDDALDTFGVHAIGGTIGAILTGFLADVRVNPRLRETAPPNPATLSGLAKAVAHHTQVFHQLEAVGVTLMLAIMVTLIIAFVLKFSIGLRPTREVETMGLDLNEHGEEGYIL